MRSPTTVDMTSPPLLAPATNPTAQKLLSVKKCRQIEVWIGETVQFEALQRCASDKAYGHASDDTPALASTPLERSSIDKPTFSAVTPSLSASPVLVCPVCSKSFQEGYLPATASSPANTRISIKSKTATTKPRAMLRGLKMTMSPFSFRAKGHSKIISENDTFDSALSTSMFRLPSAIKEDTHKNSGTQPRPPRSASSSSAPSVAGLGSPNDGDDIGVNKILNERMARLKRAQKLLEKSQCKV